MSIRGLESFIERRCPQALVDANIALSAALYRQKNKDKVSTLLINGNLCCDIIYDRLYSSGAYLGLYKPYREIWLKLLQVFEKHKIHVVFGFKGCLLDEKEEKQWLDRRKAQLNTISKAMRINNIFDNSHKKTDNNDEKTDFEKTLVAELPKTEFMKYILRLGRYEIVQLANERELMEFAVETECFGVLSVASDNFSNTEDLNCFSARFLNVNTLETKKFCRKTFARFLGIDELFLPLLGTLCGDDFLSDDDLRSFHLSLVNVSRLESSQKLYVIPRVAGWIMSHSTTITTNPSQWGDSVPSFIKLPDLKVKINQSIDSYINRVCKSSQSRVETTEGDIWSQILRMAEGIHRNEGVNGAILSVISRLRNYHGSGLVDFLSPAMIPPSGRVFEPLRKRMYGILLKDRIHQSCCQVTELVLSGLKFEESAVSIQCPNDHPGLLELWSGSTTQNKKLAMLCWAVSSKLQLEKLLLIPENLRIGCLALFYLVHEAQTYLKRRDIEVLIAVMVCLSEGDLSNQLGKWNSLWGPNKIELYVASLFTQTWFHILTVQDACGSPFMDKNSKKENTFFNGKLFQVIYRRRIEGLPGSYLSDDLVQYEDIMNFLGLNAPY